MDHGIKFLEKYGGKRKPQLFAHQKLSFDIDFPVARYANLIRDKLAKPRTLKLQI